jgi:polysaccharide deacetylase family protein (PEP-CTERM system associated)
MLNPGPPPEEDQSTMHSKLTLPVLRNELEPAGSEAPTNSRGIRAATAARIANAFTIDVEDYYHVSALAPAIPRDTWKDRESRVSASTERLLSLLDEHHVKGTFFVLGWVADHVPQLIKRIAALGHEIACHGYSHELIYRQSPEVFAEETRRAKTLLEDLTGLPVVGYRAASFSITPRSSWALDTLIELGFTYDSSIFPVRHDRYGMPGAARAPGLVQAPSGRQIVEFPMSTAQMGPLRVPVSGGGYFRLLPYWFTRRGLRSINEREGKPFTFYLHPWEIDADQPRVEVSWLSRFRHYTNLSECEPRLRRLLSEFRFTTMRKVLRGQGLLSG